MSSKALNDYELRQYYYVSVVCVLCIVCYVDTLAYNLQAINHQPFKDS